jgi:hypothetical protein
MRADGLGQAVTRAEEIDGAGLAVKAKPLRGALRAALTAPREIPEINPKSAATRPFAFAGEDLTSSSHPRDSV